MKDNKKDNKKEKSPSTKASKSHSPSTDAKITDLDNKWSERFSRLEALIMAKSFEPTFSSNVKVAPTHSPLHDVENVSEPFIRPSNSTTLPGSAFSAEKHQPTSKAVTSQQTSTTEFPGTGSSTLHRSRRDSISSLSSDAGSVFSDRPPLDLYVEEGELSEDQNQTVTDPDQPVSEEQNYRDTMQGIRSFMGWSHIPEMDSTASTSDDNPFAGPKTVAPGKVSDKMPTEDWLCRKLAKLNLTLVEGYPSRGSEAGGLAKDVFLRPARSQSKWYGLHTDRKTEPSQISS